jgi:hypothetical protein
MMVVMHIHHLLTGHIFHIEDRDQRMAHAVTTPIIL